MADKTKKAKPQLKKKKLLELAGLDFGTGELKAVRLKKGKQSLSLESIETIPFDLSSDESLSLPNSLSPNYAALSFSSDRAVSRVVSTVLKGDAEGMEEDALRESLNVDESFRVGSKIITRARGKNESSVLGVAIPEGDVKRMLTLFESGPPAAHAIEISFLSALNSYFLLQPEVSHEGVFCFLELGASSSSFAFVSDGDVMLLGRSNVGGNHIKKRIQTSLGLDEGLAQDLLLDKSVDISSPVHEILGSFLRQLSISRDFMTRRTDSAVSKIILSGGMCASPYMVDAFSELFGMQAQLWNPFEHLEMATPLSEELATQKYRFAAAIGAAAGGLLQQ
ncbi:pilus assembly protein PilM [Verrucomicrobiota bacterium]